MSVQGNKSAVMAAVLNYGQACADEAVVNGDRFPAWWGELSDDDDAGAEAERRVDAAWAEVIATLRALARSAS